MFKWNKEEIFEQVCKFLEKQKEDTQIFCYIWKKLTKEMRSTAQRNTYFMLFSQIWKHLWLHNEEVKAFFLIWCFWTKNLSLWDKNIEIPIVSSTTELDKVQAIFLIDCILEFSKEKNIPIQFVPRELRSLMESLY